MSHIVSTIVAACFLLVASLSGGADGYSQLGARHYDVSSETHVTTKDIHSSPHVQTIESEAKSACNCDKPNGHLNSLVCGVVLALLDDPGELYRSPINRMPVEWHDNNPRAAPPYLLKRPPRASA